MSQPTRDVVGVRQALAIVLAERQQQTRNAEANWKQKALTARKTLSSLSTALRKIPHAQCSDLSESLLQALAAQDDNSEPVAPQRLDSSLSCIVGTKADDLRNFVLAVEVVNAVQDLHTAKLSLIWETRALQQLANALFISFLRLPKCSLRSHYIARTTEAVLVIVESGHWEGLDQLVTRLMQASMPDFEQIDSEEGDKMSCPDGASKNAVSIKPISAAATDALEITTLLHQLSRQQLVGATICHTAVALAATATNDVCTSNDFKQATSAMRSSVHLLSLVQEVVKHLPAWLDPDRWHSHPVTGPRDHASVPASAQESGRKRRRTQAHPNTTLSKGRAVPGSAKLSTAGSRHPSNYSGAQAAVQQRAQVAHDASCQLHGDQAAALTSAQTHFRQASLRDTSQTTTPRCSRDRTGAHAPLPHTEVPGSLNAFQQHMDAQRAAAVSKEAEQRTTALVEQAVHQVVGMYEAVKRGRFLLWPLLAAQIEEAMCNVTSALQVVAAGEAKVVQGGSKTAQSSLAATKLRTCRGSLLSHVKM